MMTTDRVDCYTNYITCLLIARKYRECIINCSKKYYYDMDFTLNDNGYVSSSFDHLKTFNFDYANSMKINECIEQFKQSVEWERLFKKDFFQMQLIYEYLKFFRLKCYLHDIRPDNPLHPTEKVNKLNEEDIDELFYSDW